MGRSLLTLKEIDPKGLIADAFAIEGIGPSECRTIFLDWAISVPPDQGSDEMLPLLAAHYADKDPDHPMSKVLAEGLSRRSDPPGRRGGARGRRA
ncbi:MAG: hypothetical protein AAGO57_03100 [Pseudomonadota bacterium]